MDFIEVVEKPRDLAIYGLGACFPDNISGVYLAMAVDA